MCHGNARHDAFYGADEVGNRIGWHELRRTGSHRVLVKNAQRNVFAFHEGGEIGPRMLTRIAKHTGLKPEDL